MFATVISTILATRLEPESIYTLKLKLRGIDPLRKRNENILAAIQVQDAMTVETEMATVTTNISLPELAIMFHDTGHHGYVVLDHGELFGVVTIADLEHAMPDQEAEVLVSDICTRNVVTVYPDETLDEALRHFGALDVGRIPVVDRGNPRHVVGILRRNDIVQALSTSVVDSQMRKHHMERLKMEPVVQAELTELMITNMDAACGKRLSDLSLPADGVIVSLQRGKNLIVPRGFTQLLAGDRVIALVGKDSLASFKKILREGEEKEG
jgi:CIC family chloride channel protein